MVLLDNAPSLYHRFCPCGCFDSFKDQEIGFIKEFRYWLLLLNWEQGFLGRSLLVLKAHRTDELEMTDEEALEKHVIYKLWREAIAKAFAPDKINQLQLGNEEYLHKGHLHGHLVPRYRRPVQFAGSDFQNDDAQSQKLSYALVHKRIVYPPDIRLKIKEELLKHWPR